MQYNAMQWIWQIDNLNKQIQSFMSMGTNDNSIIVVAKMYLRGFLAIYHTIQLSHLLAILMPIDLLYLSFMVFK